MSTAGVDQSDVVPANSRRSVRLLVILEANTVTGPAKNLLDFCRLSKFFTDTPVEPFFLVFQRIGSGFEAHPNNEVAEQSQRYGVRSQCLAERFTFDPFVIRGLKQAVRHLDPDVIQTHGFKSHFLVRLCGAHKNRVWVAFHHGYTNTTYRRELLKHLDRWSLRAPSLVVTVSKAFAKQLCDYGVESTRIRVLHNAVDPDWLLTNHSQGSPNQSDDQALSLPPGERLVLAVGRLSKEKGFLHLVTAMAELKRIRPNSMVRLVIAGEGPHRASLEHAICRAGLSDRIQLVGQVNDVRPFFRIADLLAISSLSEGSPNVLLEAMTAGVPVVATAVGGIPEIVKHGETALLVAPNDPVALAQGINRLLQDPNLAAAISCRARRVVEMNHSPLHRTRNLIELYERLCAQERFTLNVNK